MLKAKGTECGQKSRDGAPLCTPDRGTEGGGVQAGEAARPRTESQDVQSHDGTTPSGGKRAAGGEGEGRGNRGRSMQGEAGLRTQSKAGKRGVGHLHRHLPLDSGQI